MLVLPDRIKTALEHLRTEYKFFVSLKKINGKYYLYKQTSVWNKEKKKLKVISTYLGRITDEGVFVKKEVTHQDELENAKALILAHGGKVLLPKIEDGVQIPITGLMPDEVEKKILSALSMDARESLVSLGKKVELTPSATYNKVKKMEKKYNIRYFAEIDVQKLGYLWYSFAAKFDETKPSFDSSRESLNKFSEVQLALFTKGNYDLIIFFLAENYDAADALAYKVMTCEAFSRYSSTWNIIPIEENYGVIPLRDVFFEKLKERVYERKKENQHKKYNEIYRRDYVVLRELNNNGTIDFSEIDTKYNFDKGRSRYTYHELIKRGIIERVTVNLRSFENKRLDILFIELKNAKQFFDTRAPFLNTIIEDSPAAINKYSFIGDIGTPAGIMAILPVLEENDSKNLSEYLLKKVKGMKISDIIVSGIIVGSFCYRKFDNSSSIQYKILMEK
ncbi:MAG: AsnC family transcriptional regulator [Candidatus Micrarchaeota archaeon]|nr:AsnC family transcriptional regulator [Candidatus Micrarchaeota archaeon]